MYTDYFQYFQTKIAVLSYCIWKTFLFQSLKFTCCCIRSTQVEYFTPYSWTSRTLGKGTCVHTTRNRAMMIGHWHYHKCKPIPRAGLVRDWNQTSDKSRPQGCPGARQTGLDLVCSNKRLTPPPPFQIPHNSRWKGTSGIGWCITLSFHGCSSCRTTNGATNLPG